MEINVGGKSIRAGTILIAIGLILPPLSSYGHSKCRASYYGTALHGRTTANGERYNMHAMTAAHKTLRFGTRVRVTKGARSVVVRINDRGPFIRGRCIDLSKAAARHLGMIHSGTALVTLEVL